MAQFPNFSTFLRDLYPKLAKSSCELLCPGPTSSQNLEKKNTLWRQTKWRVGFFWGSALGCSQTDIDPQEDLAKFGYKLEFMKVRKI
jgi:hypothetical protein